MHATRTDSWRCEYRFVPSSCTWYSRGHRFFFVSVLICIFFWHVVGIRRSDLLQPSTYKFSIDQQLEIVVFMFSVVLAQNCGSLADAGERLQEEQEEAAAPLFQEQESPQQAGRREPRHPYHQHQGHRPTLQPRLGQQWHAAHVNVQPQTRWRRGVPWPGKDGHAG